MLGIILIAILLIIAIFEILIIIGASVNKSEDEKRVDDEEQIKYIKEYVKNNKKNK